MGRKSQKRRAAKGKQPKNRREHTAPTTATPLFPVVLRDETEVIGDRVYPPTMRVTLADVGQTVQLDAIASMCAIAEGRITGDDARYVAALVASVEEAEGLLSRDDMDLDEYMASHGRLLEAGFIGYDEHGGYLTAPAGAPAGFAELLKS